MQASGSRTTARLHCRLQVARLCWKQVPGSSVPLHRMIQKKDFQLSFQGPADCFFKGVDSQYFGVCRSHRFAGGVAESCPCGTGAARDGAVLR